MPMIDRTISKSSLEGNNHKNGLLFLPLIWMAFFLPAANWSNFPLLIGYTNLSELAIIAMPFVYALYPRKRAIASGTKYSFLKKTILLFFVLTFFVIILQFLVYGGSFSQYFQAKRILIPLYVSLLLIYLGPRINPKLLLLNLCLCLSASSLISLFCFVMDIEVTPFFVAPGDAEENFQILREGRIYNVNMGFAYLAMGLLIGISLYRKYLRPAWLFIVILVCCLLFIMISYISFSRTFIIISLLFLLFLNLKFFSLRTIIATLSLMILVSTASYFTYNYSDTVQQQVKRRIIMILQEQDGLLENVYFNNRESLYDDYWKAGKDYYLLGVPPNVPVTQKFINGEYKEVNVSDISLVTVFLRLGIIPLFVYFFIGILFYKYIWNMDIVRAGPWNRMIHFSLTCSLPFMALASLNADILARQYPILFISLLFLALSFNTPVLKRAKVQQTT